MRNRTKVTYLSVDHLEEQDIARTKEAERLPPGEARRHALKNVAQLRASAAMKKLLAPGFRAKLKDVANVND